MVGGYTMTKEQCDLCGEKIEGFGNNAEPLAHGRCCDFCNTKVIYERMIRIKIKEVEN